MKNLFILFFLALMLSACNSITFVQNEQEGEQLKQKRWHHGTINGLVELSAPLDIRQFCGDKTWNTIKTELTFLNSLVNSVIPKFGALSFYSAWTNEIECFVPLRPQKLNKNNG